MASMRLVGQLLGSGRRAKGEEEEEGLPERSGRILDFFSPTYSMVATHSDSMRPQTDLQCSVQHVWWCSGCVMKATYNVGRTDGSAWRARLAVASGPLPGLVRLGPRGVYILGAFGHARASGSPAVKVRERSMFVPLRPAGRARSAASRRASFGASRAASFALLGSCRSRMPDLVPSVNCRCLGGILIGPHSGEL